MTCNGKSTNKMWLPEMSEMRSEYPWEWQKLYLPWILNEEADTVAAGASFPFVRASPVWWAKFGWVESRGTILDRWEVDLIFARFKSLKLRFSFDRLRSRIGSQ